MVKTEHFFIFVFLTSRRISFTFKNTCDAVMRAPCNHHVIGNLDENEIEPLASNNDGITFAIIDIAKTFLWGVLLG